MVLESGESEGVFTGVKSMAGAGDGNVSEVDPERRNLSYVLLNHIPHSRRQPGDSTQPPASGREDFDLLRALSILHHSYQSLQRHALCPR